MNRTFKILFGALTCGLAAYGVWQIISQNTLSDVGQWFVNGGSEQVSFGGGDYNVNARALGSGILLLPTMFAALGVWALFSAFRKTHDEVV